MALIAMAAIAFIALFPLAFAGPEPIKVTVASKRS